MLTDTETRRRAACARARMKQHRAGDVARVLLPGMVAWEAPISEAHVLNLFPPRFELAAVGILLKAFRGYRPGCVVIAGSWPADPEAICEPADIVAFAPGPISAPAADQQVTAC